MRKNSMKTFLIAMLAFLFCLTISAGTTRSDETLKATHTNLITQYGHDAVLQGTHSFMVIGAMRMEGTRSYSCSVFVTDAAFCAYAEVEEGSAYLYSEYCKTESELAFNSTYHLLIGTKAATIEFYYSFPLGLPNQSGCMTAVRSDLPDNNTTTGIFIGFLPYLYEAFFQFDMDMAPTIMNQMQIGLTNVIFESGARNGVKSTRAIVTKNFSWSVSTGQVAQYGDGTVINFHLWITGGYGSVRHEIMAGYLVLTGLAGTMSGTGVIYMNHP